MPKMITKRLNDLIRLLEQTRDIYEQLLQTIQTKIDAMRHADLNEMREQTLQEHALAKLLHEREGLRCQIMELIGIELHMSASQARAMTMSDLSKSVSKSDAKRLMEISGTLRDTVTRVAFLIDLESFGVSGEEIFAENISSFGFTFYDLAGTEITDIANNEGEIARVHVQLTAETENPNLESGQIQTITLQSDVMLRSKMYGLFK